MSITVPIHVCAKHGQIGDEEEDTFIHRKTQPSGSKSSMALGGCPNRCAGGTMHLHFHKNFNSNSTSSSNINNQDHAQ
jgi:hypothetical protein